MVENNVAQCILLAWTHVVMAIAPMCVKKLYFVGLDYDVWLAMDVSCCIVADLIVKSTRLVTLLLHQLTPSTLG